MLVLAWSEVTYRTKTSRALLSESIALKLEAASMVPLTRSLDEGEEACLLRGISRRRGD
jgi:hypothetical protein